MNSPHSISTFSSKRGWEIYTRKHSHAIKMCHLWCNEMRRSGMNAGNIYERGNQIRHQVDFSSKVYSATCSSKSLEHRSSTTKLVGILATKTYKSSCMCAAYCKPVTSSQICIATAQTPRYTNATIITSSFP